MKTHIRRLFIALPLVLVLFGSILTSTVASAHSATTASSPEIVTSGPINQDVAKVLAFWTPERMRTAHPVNETVALAKSTSSTVKHGTPGFIPPTAPLGLKPLTSGTAGQVPHSYYSSFPYSTVGKVFYLDKAGATWVCSGSALNSTNKSVVDTAGHCVVQGGSGNNWFITKWMFCPQYYYGQSSVGCWVARELVSTAAWVNSGSQPDDFGEAIVSPNSKGYLVNMVGGAGGAYNLSTSQNFAALGYPQASPFDGNSMYQCGPTFPSVVLKQDDDLVVAIPCNMTPGSSGGSWFIPYNGSLYVNGHVDFSSTFYPGQIFSPYYDSEWFSLFNLAQSQ